MAGFGAKQKAVGQSAGNESSPSGIPVQIGRVDFSDKSVVLERLDAGQKETTGLKHEVNYTVTTDGKVWRMSGETGSVNSSAIPSGLDSSYSYHNHPTAKSWFSFSAEDVRFFFESGAAYSKASDQMYEYVMQRTQETLAVEPEIVYHRFKELYSGDVMELSFDEKIDIDRDGFYETMIRLSKEYHFFYERVKLNDG